VRPEGDQAPIMPRGEATLRPSSPAEPRRLDVGRVRPMRVTAISAGVRTDREERPAREPDWHVLTWKNEWSPRTPCLVGRSARPHGGHVDPQPMRNVQWPQTPPE
jgi:hypothetical protein